MRSIICIFLACAILFVQSCQHSKADKGNLDNWLKESKMISHNKLLNFSYKKADIEKVELGKINKQIIGDTLIANFYLELPPRCLEIGNVLFLGDTVELQIGHACNPHKAHRNRKKSIFTFKYKILNTNHLENKNFRIKEFVNEMEG